MHSPSSQALGLLQNAIASQAFAFFTGSGPFPKRDSFTGIRLLHRLWAFLGGEPPEVLDVPCVLDRLPLLSLQAHGASPGNMNNLKRALPHGRELMQPLLGENPSEHKVPYLESAGGRCGSGITAVLVGTLLPAARLLGDAPPPARDPSPAWRPSALRRMPGPTRNNV